MYYFQVYVLIISCGFSRVSSFFHFTHRDYFLFKNSASFNKSSLRSDQIFGFEQPLDHFNQSDQRTFMLKYYQVMDSWKPGGPILVYLNGESPLNYNGEDASIVGQLVQETGAAYFMMEHRYYGASKPFDEPTTEDLAFLSSKQALADTALFLRSLKDTQMYNNSKVMVVGGSYAGNLAAWMKVLYPDLVDAVLSSSAPVLAKPDFYEYFETVTDTFSTYGSPDCVNKINEKFNRLHELLQSSEGIEKLKEEYEICKEVDMTVPANQHIFFVEQVTPYSFYAQYGTPADIRRYCQDFKFNFSQSLDLFPFIRLDCNKYDYDDYISWLTGTIWLWTYQTCTEFGYYQSSTSNKQMFGNYSVPVDLYYNTCKSLFGEEFNEERVKQGVIDTNKRYNGLTPHVKHVVFTHGDMDPWHRLGVLQDLSVDAPAIYIKGSSHCQDLYPQNTDDNEDVKEARKTIKKLMKQWIGAA